ncbi:MAG: hypothetical protein Q8K63_00575 [Acidimicrobiales bacterium]|nr:hypothetical protein [Acidimicrobiales bacterium]
MRFDKRLGSIAVVAASLLASGVVSATPAGAARWTPLANATIHPGVQTISGNSQCTANFVFVNGDSVLLGQAAHCAGTGPANETNGCTAEALPVGLPVRISGASRPGVLVYSSWDAMKQARETNVDLCRHNDFALVRIDPADVAKVNPSVPKWGGPTGVSERSSVGRTNLYTYGNSNLRFGLTALSPLRVVGVETTAGGRNHLVYSVTPGIPGDSGSGLLDNGGKAIGVLSTIGLTPLPLSNNYTDLRRAMAYARSHGMPNLQLVNGTKPFSYKIVKAGQR